VIYQWRFRIGLPFCVSFDSAPSNTGTDVDSDPLSVIDALTSLQAIIRWSLMVQEMTEEAYGAFFNVPPKNKGQKLIFFGWFKSEPMTRKSSENNFESPQFYHYRQNFHHMMKKMGYNLGKRSGLNFGKGRRVLLWSFVPKGKALDYYHKTRRGFGYVSTPVPLNSKSKESPCHDHSSGTSSWEPDVSIGAIINSLLANMVSTSHLKDEDE